MGSRPRTSLVELLAEAGGSGGMTYSDLKRALFRHRPRFDEAMDGLTKADQVRPSRSPASNGSECTRYTFSAGVR